MIFYRTKNKKIHQRIRIFITSEETKKTIIGYRTRFFKNCHQKNNKTGEFIGNKIAEAVTNSHYDKIAKAKPVEEIIIPIERRKVILKELAQVLKKWNTTKYLSY